MLLKFTYNYLKLYNKPGFARFASKKGILGCGTRTPEPIGFKF